MSSFINGINPMFPFLPPLFWLLIVWCLVWMGVALWKSARKGDKVWFIIFLLIHTLGILEIFYIFFWDKVSKKVERLQNN